MRLDGSLITSRRLVLGAYAAVLLVALVALVPRTGVAGLKSGPVWVEKDWTRWTYVDCEKFSVPHLGGNPIRAVRAISL